MLRHARRWANIDWAPPAPMGSDRSSSYCSDSDDDDYDGDGGGRRLDIPHSALTEVQDYAQAFAPLDADVLGQDSSGDDDDDFLLDAAFSGKKGVRGGTCSPQAIAPRLACPRPSHTCVGVQQNVVRPARHPTCFSISVTDRSSGPRYAMPHRCAAACCAGASRGAGGWEAGGG